MRHEGHPDLPPGVARQAAGDLGRVLVAADPIGAQVAKTSEKLSARSALRPAPEVPEIAVTLTASAVAPVHGQGRRRGELRHRRVAAGAGDQLGPEQRLREQLGEPVDRRAQQLGHRVLAAVPAPVGRGVGQTQVSGEVEHATDLASQRAPRRSPRRRGAGPGRRRRGRPARPARRAGSRPGTGARGRGRAPPTARRRSSRRRPLPARRPGGRPAAAPTRLPSSPRLRRWRCGSSELPSDSRAGGPASA